MHVQHHTTKTAPSTVDLARQLIERQPATSDPSNLEDRYETRLRSMIDTKLEGEGIGLEEPVPPNRTDVVDLMAALKRSLGQTTEAPEPRNSRGASAAGALCGRKVHDTIRLELAVRLRPATR